MINNEMNKNNNPNYKYGRWLSSPSPGNEVVISGMSGHLPDSETIDDFRENLMNKVDMINGDARRWNLEHPEIPQRTAKIYNIDRFDPGYFSIHYREANSLDPLIRIFLETAVEAVMDAGVNPSELRGTYTGVFVGTFWSDTEHVNVMEEKSVAVTSYLRSFISHRVSYHLKLNGPTCLVDTACSSSFNALDMAHKAIRSGQCDSALVGGANLLLHPGNCYQFFRLGVLSADGFSKVFDQNANGYVRGETIACLFLQKSKNARRIYANVINTKASFDGFKEHGITFPSYHAQMQLMEEIYEESNLKADDLSFLEAHGTGTAVGDPEEAEAIDLALGKKRKNQLLVGSVKSSIGHTEPSSGIASIIKVIIAMESGTISPNINLNQIKNGMKGFEQGRLKLVTEKTTLNTDDAIIGINNFGFGGTNCHGILRRHKYKKISQLEDDLPRLVCISGRSKEAVITLLESTSKNFDAEYVGLLHQIYKTKIENHLYRGFTIITKAGPDFVSCEFEKYFPLVVVFGTFHKNFRTLGTYLFQFPVFKETMLRVNNIFEKHNIPTLGHILKNSISGYDILGSLCVQIGVIDILKQLKITPAAIYDETYHHVLKSYYYEDVNFETLVANSLNNSSLKDDQIHRKNSRIDYANSCTLNICDIRLDDSELVLVDDGKVTFLNTLGQLYVNGHNPQIHKLYPSIKFPVSRGTPMISPMVRWDHRKTWNVYKFATSNEHTTEQKDFVISLTDDDFKFIGGHVIDGRVLLPATEYLNLVWETLFQKDRFLKQIVPVTFLNCRFVRAVSIQPDDVIKLSVQIEKSGKFEIFEKSSLVANGTVLISASQELELEPLLFNDKNALDILEHDDIYTELRLRGYHYSGLFKGVEKCNIAASAGFIKWEENWSAFMDKMLQIKILQTDSRLLFIPVGFKQLTISPMKHQQLVAKHEKSLLPVSSYKECNIIKSGGIEIRGLQTKSISRKKTQSAPILEKCTFVPNCSSLCLPDAVKSNTQIILENSLKTQFKAVEIIDEYTKSNVLLLNEIDQILNDIPMVISDLIISSKKPLDESHFKVADVPLSNISDILLIIGTKILQRSDILEQALQCVGQEGYVLTREEVTVTETRNDIQILTQFTTPEEQLILFRRTTFNINELKCLEISRNHFTWLPQLQDWISHNQTIVVYSKNDDLEGVLGLVNCIRRENNGQNVKCFFLMDKNVQFEKESAFFKKQIQKDLAFNVFKNNTWGTYRHLLLEELVEHQSEHCYVNMIDRSGFGSLRWMEGPLDANSRENFYSIYYAPLNFKDVVIASGRANVEAFSLNRLHYEKLLGFEFSGRDSSGTRVCGMVLRRGLSSKILDEEAFVWKVPDQWTLQEAATIPVVYLTVACAFFIETDLKPGTSVLIHSGTGGIGLAALNICTFFKCNIYVTVGTQEKREFLKKHFPQIPESHIGNSHELSFEQMIKTETKGRGVDVVLNSLSEDKLQASVRCLAKGGKFMEIGVVDIANDTFLKLSLLQKEASFHAIMLNKVKCPDTRAKLKKIIADGMAIGFVKPIPFVVFQKEELENSFKYMTTGKHIGKVLLEIREEENEKIAVPKKMLFNVRPRFNCYSHCSYVIIGGLGGIGLELADWLVLREAKNLVLVSRTGVQKGYQKQRIRIWESHGVNVHIYTNDVTTEKGSKNLLQSANKIGPIDVIFNLAAVLKDALFENQSEDNFMTSLQPKANVAIFLDKLTRELCPTLRHFVMFSSVSCGRGNAGQTNYGMANSIMERVCEKRALDGFPALAIQWGAIGEVGMIAKMQKQGRELVIGGTIPQTISSCVEVLDRFLKQKNVIVSSMVIAEKHDRNVSIDSPVDAIANVLGIKNVKSVSLHATMAELGADSMMGTEIIQLLENKFDIYLTSQEIRDLTFAKLYEIESGKKTTSEEKVIKTEYELANALILPLFNIKDPHSSLVKLSSASKDINKTVVLLPGTDGSLTPFDKLTKEINANIFGFQYNFKNAEDTIEGTARNVLMHIKKELPINSTFVLIGYSFGGIVALELAAMLNSNLYLSKIIIIDSSPSYLRAAIKSSLPEETEAEFQISLMYKALETRGLHRMISQYKEQLLKCKNFEEKIKLGQKVLPPEFIESVGFNKETLFTQYKRLTAMINYKFEKQKIKTSVHLLRAKTSMIQDETDYQLSKICESDVTVTILEGTHMTILANPHLTKQINNLISTSVQ